MTPTLRIDLTAIDTSEFKLTVDGAQVLIQPHRTKHRWRDTELHLRSLVTDPQGHVLSAGFPKFFNYGEHPPHDAHFVAALARGEVQFAEKLDGSLLVADSVAGAPRLRTRGSLGLNTFEQPVHDVIAARYPGLLALLTGPGEPALRDHSLMLEFVSPAHAIVVQYAEPALYLLGLVSKHTGRPRWDDALLASISARTGVPAAPTHALPDTVDGVLASVRAWSGREGVVARFTAPGVGPLMLKLKANEYLRLHASRVLFGGNNARRLAFLLDLASHEAVGPAFAQLGLDYEAAEFTAAQLRGYFPARAEGLARLEALSAVVAPWVAAASHVPTKTAKRDFVERVRAHLATNTAEDARVWFDVAMRLFDGRPDDARLRVLAEIVEEPVPTLRAWLKDPAREVQAMLSVVVRDEE